MKITIQDISKSFGARDIFGNFSLEIESGERLCVCGPNGSGKSTFLRLLSGQEEPDAGRIILPKNCRLGYVEQEFSSDILEIPLLNYVMDVVHDWGDFWKRWDTAAHSDKAVLHTLMEEQGRLEAQYGYNPEQRAKETLSGLGFSEARWMRPLTELSGGWRERAKLARVLTAGADVLLLDEPTNHLDLEAVEWLEDFLLGFSGALVFVAHDRVFMDKIGNHVLYMGLGKPVSRKTNYSKFLELQAEYDAQRELKAKALQDDLERKMAFVERFRAKATKARQAGSRQKMAKKLEKELENYKPASKRKELNFSWPKAPHCEKVALSTADLSFHFPDGKQMWPPLTFTLYNGNHVALVGHNGSGKSTLLKLVAGRLCRTGGNIALASQLRMGYYAQHQMDTLNGSSTVLGEIRRLSDLRTTEEELMSVLGLFLLGENYFERTVTSLSGGEKARLVLASLFLARCNFLLLDEPTNHLDIESREALANALKRFQGTIFMVAHDRWLLSEIGAEIWELTKDGLTYHDNFEAYDKVRKNQIASVSQRELLCLDETKEKKHADSGLSREAQKILKRRQAEARNSLHKQLKPLTMRFEKLEKEFDETVAAQEKVEKDLANPEIYADTARSSELLTKFEQYRMKTENLLEEMGALEKEIAIKKRDMNMVT